MNVGELIKSLKKFDKNAEVVLAGDPGGAFFSVLSEIEEMKHISYSDGSCRVFIKELTKDMVDEGFVEDDFGDSSDADPCVVFWPVF
jgi:hypothetical protein